MPKLMTGAGAALVVSLGVSLAAVSRPIAEPAIVPRPASMTVRPGEFRLSASTRILADAPVLAVARDLADMLAPATGLHLTVRAGAGPESGAIVLHLDRALAASLGPEGYRLFVTSHVVTIHAAAPAGVFYGIETLRQLLPPEIFRDERVDGVPWTIPAVSIVDSPRFSWRGAHLDTSRHFMPKAFIETFLDLLALHKLNRFHWHLTDDQGWRLEIKKYPKLTEVGAWRSATIVGHEPRDLSSAMFDGTRYGGFYTQDDVRAIVRYAADRFITVVPEIEMPGHSQEVVAAYPELSSTDEAAETRTHWGVSQFLLNPNDASVHFMEDVLTEVMGLFPSPWIHVGGDEADKAQWKANPAIQARIKTLGLANEDDLQSWFIRQMDVFLTSHHRRLIGWDEILAGGLAANATVMSWHGTAGAVAAVKAGHDAVLTPTATTYFDYYQSRDTAHEPLAIGGFLPLERAYDWEPMPPTLTAAEQQHILGVQGQLWTEYMPTPARVEVHGVSAARGHRRTGLDTGRRALVPRAFASASSRTS